MPLPDREIVSHSQILVELHFLDFLLPRHFVPAHMEAEEPDKRSPLRGISMSHNNL